MHRRRGRLAYPMAMQSSNPNVYEFDYGNIGYRAPLLTAFDSPIGNLAELSQAPGGT